ncbi:Pre-mRNA-splicing factor of RES complex-domain-containing protein [Hypoxylon fragiforme]|uniref:Pre-mRNA-splicing factor of RES complex-domain-containing protein n=1 Tax=Hypoxylon fragiforme TaxID=63214 RepID=UPI0020C6C71C|nr:Pre-mRNA-splicing factor of RES complex-domain-containing protein [Hypoxylon fragiforme]KAI2614393.1 Pre-mRNA-splicing factor of RES complex-domain-containing protein [Hypoxylon fragiforme]
MASDKFDYIKSQYLVADPKPSKKRKRKQKDDSSSNQAGLIIADDDETGWMRAKSNQNDDDDDTAMVAGTSAEFRKAKKSAWKVLGGGGGGLTTSASLAQDQQQQQNKDDEAADAIIASAAAETAEAGNDNDAPAIMMSDGTYAGLQTAATVSAQLEARRRAERAEYERASGGRNKKHAAEEEETIYRDATGRRVDVSMKRAELRREAQEAAAKEAAKVEALRGDVQVEAARSRREALEDAKVMPVARHADDAELNREMREKVRWGDTMARFVEPRVATEVVGAKKKKGGIKGKPVYKGAWTPNRYGIRPGYRWDGVDRSNGFEGERFKAINRRERNKGLEYAWQMDE